MDKDLFSAAQKHLTLADVYMRNASVEIDDCYEPHNEEPDEYDHQYRHVVLGTETLMPEHGTDSEVACYFRTLLQLGIRWGELQKEGGNDAEDDFIVLGKIEATFIAEYELKDPKLSDECLREFSLRAPSFHVWPYWREFVASTAMRCNVPKIVMPPMQRAQNAVEDIAELEVGEREKKNLFRSSKLPPSLSLAELPAPPGPDQPKRKAKKARKPKV